jgi:hypothetical protein
MAKSTVKPDRDDKRMDVSLKMKWREPGDDKDHYIKAFYPDKDYAFIAETERRLLKGLQTPSGEG